MKNEHETKVIEAALNRICAHKLFVNSDIHSNLLKYLVEKALKEEELNEVTIGSDLYGIDYSENKNNSTVRSYIYKLRKKLTAYYSDAAAHETIIFEIIKGQYNLSFIAVNAYYKQQTSANKSVTIPAKYLKLLGGFMLIAVLTVIIARTISAKPSFVWENYFEKNAQNLLVISDQFIIYEKLSDGKFYGITYPEINNHNDLIEYSQKNPDKIVKPTDYTLMSKMGPYTVKSLTQWFMSNASDFQLALESKFKYEDMQNHNILFVGQFKTMNLSKSLFLKDSKVFTTFKDGFKYQKDGTKKEYVTQYGNHQNVEYAMVSYTAIRPEKSILYFVSNNDIGVLATVRKFTDPDLLEEFKKELPEGATHFNALFEVKGLQRNDISCKLVALEVLK